MYICIYNIYIYAGKRAAPGRQTVCKRKRCRRETQRSSEGGVPRGGVNRYDQAILASPDLRAPLSRQGQGGPEAPVHSTIPRKFECSGLTPMLFYMLTHIMTKNIYIYIYTKQNNICMCDYIHIHAQRRIIEKPNMYLHVPVYNVCSIYTCGNVSINL